MTKLTLPIQAGKTYVQRDGTVVTPHACSLNDDAVDTENTCINVDTGIAFYAWGVDEGNQDHDIVSDYIEPTQGATTVNQPIPAYEKLIDSVRRELAEAGAYREAFYQVAKMVDVNLTLPDPFTAWHQQLGPNLQMKLDNAARMNRALHQAGAALGLNVGDDLTTMLLPAIEKLKAHAAELSKGTPPAGQTFTASQLEEAFLFAQSFALDYFKKDLAIK
jgi:hypothetical protein